MFIKIRNFLNDKFENNHFENNRFGCQLTNITHLQTNIQDGVHQADKKENCYQKKDT